MTNSEKKQRLQQYGNLKDEVDRLQDEIEQLQSRAEKMTAVLSAEPMGSGSKDRMAVVDEIIERKKLLEAKQKEASAACDEIEKAIGTVQNQLFRQILEWKYINGWTWSEIAERKNKSYHHIVARIHPAALSMIQWPEKS